MGNLIFNTNFPGLFHLLKLSFSIATIYVMTQGGPGDASETINIYLFNQAFSYYQIGYASAVVILFLVIIGAASFGLIRLRQGTAWRSA